MALGGVGPFACHPIGHRENLSALNPATLNRAEREASTSATKADRKTKKPITNISFRSPVRLGVNLSQAMMEIKNSYWPVFSEQQTRIRPNVGLSAQPKLWI